MTRFLGLMPALRVADLDRSIEWYANVLGFEARGRAADDGDGAHAFVGAGGVELLLSTGAHLGGPPALTGVLYFRVAGVDALHDRVRGRAEAEVEVVWPLEVQSYGTREFGIRDPDGYILAFAEEAGP